MPDISKHNGEEEGEGDDREQAGVDLLVRRDTIRVDDGLEALGELVRAVERRRVLVRAQLVQDRRDARAGVLLLWRSVLLKKEREERVTYGSKTKRALNSRNVPGRNPPLSEERLPPLIPLPEVERRVDNLLPPNNSPPSRDALGDLDELGATGLVRVIEDRVEILDARRDFAELLLALVVVRVDREERGAHGCGKGVRESTRGGARMIRTFSDLADLVEQLLPVRKDNEDVLAKLLLFSAGRIASDRGRDGERRVVDLGVLFVARKSEGARRLIDKYARSCKGYRGERARGQIGRTHV